MFSCGLLSKYSDNIFSRAFISGSDTSICLSNLPGLRSALSNISSLLVAAITTIPVSYTHLAIDRGLDSIVKITVTDSWKNAEDENVEETKAVPEFIKDIVVPINRQEGDKIPVSTFIKHNMDDGTFMHGTSAYEKRGIAVNVPEWDNDKCIQCNQCSFVCPHAAIRPFLLNEKETKNAPANFKIVPAKGLKTEEPRCV